MTILSHQKGLGTVSYANLTSEASNPFDIGGVVTGVNFESNTGKSCGFKSAIVKGTAVYTGICTVTGSHVNKHVLIG